MWQDRARTLTALAPGLINFRKPWIWFLIFFTLWGLCLGALAPWLIKNTLQNSAAERLNSTLTIERLRINPYLMSVTVDNLELVSNSRARLGFEHLYINFQLSSLFRWAWSFKEAHLLGVYANLERYKDGTSNIEKLAQQWLTTAEPSSPKEEQSPENKSGDIPRVYIHDLQLSVKEIHTYDEIPQTPFRSTFGPLSLNVEKLSTLENKSGQQKVSLSTFDGAEISWQGNISLNPLGSDGHVTLKGPFFDLPARYLQDTLNFDVDSGELTANLDYSIHEKNSEVHVQIVNINAYVRDLLLVQKHNNSALFKLPELEISGGELHWPSNTFSLQTIDFKNAEVWLEQSKSGEINLNKLFKQSSREKPSKPPQQTEKNSPEWRVSNNTFRLSNWSVYFLDKALSSPANINIDNIRVQLEGLSNQENTPLAIEASAEFATGQMSAHGQFTPIPFSNMEIQSQLDALDLAILQPYIAAYANVELKKSLLSAETKITATNKDQLVINSNLNLSAFKLLDKTGQQALLQWENLQIGEIEAKLQEDSVAVGSVTLDKAYIDFSIAEDGSTTVDRVLVHKAETASKKAPAQSTTKNALEFSIASITISDTSGKFSDASLPLPFATDFTKLSGNITTLASNSREPADIALEGKVDEFGLMRIKGALTPFDPRLNTDIKLSFKNLDIPKLSPYAMKFAGRSIEKGKLNVDLGYRVQHSKLQGSNNIELQKLKLGNKVEQHGAMNLPLDMAVALLKDGDGNIEVALPVKGDVNDPKFNYGKVIGQAFARLITSIVASPFRLLGSLVGSGEQQLSQVYFDPGSSEITPPEKEKLINLVAALQQRPTLQLDISGVYVAALDEKALKAELFNKQEIEKFGEQGLKALSRVSKSYLKFIESQFLASNEKSALDQLKTEHTATTGENSRAHLDTLAYANHIREYLIDAIDLPAQQLLGLADERAQQLQHFLVVQNDLSKKRVVIQPSEASTTSEDELIQLELKLESL